MNILVVGSGGREHALCWSVRKSPLCDTLLCAPGNAGIAAVAECVPADLTQNAEILNICSSRQIDFVIIGPEGPLALGLADVLRDAGIPCFGPGQKAAEIESSKGFMKDLAAEAGVPTAEYRRFTSPDDAKNYLAMITFPIVIKADGLAAGKGVTIASNLEEARRAVDDAMVEKVFGTSGTEIVIEEFMRGEEVSFFALCDGETAIPFASAQDHKAAFDGDKGPNTGGMGAYSPAPIVDTAMQDRIMTQIIIPVLNLMKKKGRPFTGVLFAGLMMTSGGPKLIEFNARFGDPETQVMLPRLKTDLLAVLYAASKVMLDAVTLEWYSLNALSVVMAANGYPGAYQKNTVIQKLNDAATVNDTLVFHSGTVLDGNGILRSTGGRVLCVTGLGETLQKAQTQAYTAIGKIDWPDGFYRSDIGWRALGRTK